jgi:hypothetical protein
MSAGDQNCQSASPEVRYGPRHGGQRPLCDVAMMWPSPRSEDSESCGNHPGAADSLNAEARLWPTPNVPNWGPETAESKGMRPDTGGIDLQTIAGLWQTPIAPAGGGSGRGGRRIDEPMLDGQARKWATPQLPSGGAPQPGHGPHRNLMQDAVGFRSSLPDPPTLTLGGGSSKSTRRLNPRFVEWLMGLPPNWTVAGRIGFGRAEMASWLSRRRMRLCDLLKGYCPVNDK